MLKGRGERLRLAHHQLHLVCASHGEAGQEGDYTWRLSEFFGIQPDVVEDKSIDARFLPANLAGSRCMQYEVDRARTFLES